MKKLSKKEWIATALAVIFVAYTLFGGDIMSLFDTNTMDPNSLASVVGSETNRVITNDIVVGNGPEVKSGNLVSVHYILSLTDGVTIQNSKDFGTPFQFVLGAGEVIAGWDQGLLGMKVGGVRTLIIPPELAYGPNQAGPIPPNSTLIFTIELLGVTEAPAQAGQ